MISNLLDKTVLYQDAKAKICAIYERNAALWFGLLTSDGRFVFNILPEQVLVPVSNYKVYVRWGHDSKIRTIAYYRTMKQIGLKEAKEAVEASPYRVLLAENLDHDEAKEMLEKLKAQNLEGEIDG